MLAFLMRRMPTGVRKFAWWWERLYRAIGGGGFVDDASIDARWPTGEQGPIRSRRFGQRMFLDLQVWPERRTYFSGVYFQQELEYLFPSLLRQRDQYLDIGANIGMTSLMASSLIGPEGRGFSFEPNPEAFSRLRRHFKLNRISNLEPVPFALSDREAEARLVLPSRNSGLGSLAGDYEGPARSVKVRAVTGRPYVERLDPGRPTLVKIDVEGHEVKALKGIETILDWPEVAIISEVNDEMLRRAGDSADGLFDLLKGRGFRAFLFSLRHGRFKCELVITPIESFRDARGDDWFDALFAKPDSGLYRERIAPLPTAGQ